MSPLGPPGVGPQGSQAPGRGLSTPARGPSTPPKGPTTTTTQTNQGHTPGIDAHAQIKTLWPVLVYLHHIWSILA